MDRFHWNKEPSLNIHNYIVNISVSREKKHMEQIVLFDAHFLAPHLHKSLYVKFGRYELSPLNKLCLSHMSQNLQMRWLQIL